MIVDLYAGIGWSVALAELGMADVGIEWMPAACATRALHGFPTIRADLTTYPLRPSLPLTGYIASPPCQSFSAAGSGEGTAVLPQLVAAVAAGDWSLPVDERTAHVLRVARDLSVLSPEWVALEQVPQVLPVWDQIGRRLSDRGYSVWGGVLNAADHGVPQTRRRAFLLASRVRAVSPPEPSHSVGGCSGLFGERLPWVSMAEALGWEMTERPGYTLALGGDSPDTTGGGSGARAGFFRERTEGRWLNRRTNSRGASWVWEQPATTLAGDPRITARCHHDEGSQGADARTTSQVRAGDYDGTQPIRLTIEEAKVLQSFPRDMVLCGPRTAQFLQVGNAVPPLLARKVIEAVS